VMSLLLRTMHNPYIEVMALSTGLFFGIVSLGLSLWAHDLEKGRHRGIAWLVYWLSGVVLAVAVFIFLRWVIAPFIEPDQP
jgi:phosphoglycerol transferase MdoB-like AlkP superfamily enzyme